MIDAEQPPTSAWYERVPSVCNIAELPRGDYMQACSMICGEAKGDIQLAFEVVKRLEVQHFC